MIRFTWNGLNPWIILKASINKASINYFCLWIKIWFKDFRRQNIGTAVIKKKGQTMSNAQITITPAEADKFIKGAPLPKQGSDEVQVTVTVQDEEEIEKTGTAPTLH